MPSLPAPLAARAERWFGRPWTRGQEVEFRVGDREFRHYTPSSVDPDSGRFDVVFVRHGNAPGTAWLAGLRLGAEVGVMGPGGGVRREPAPEQVCLAGHVGSIEDLRRRVRLQYGLGRRAVATKAHWADGKQGL